MRGWDDDVPLLVQIAEEFVEAAMMHPGDVTEALMIERVAAMRRRRDAERKRLDRLCARPADAGVVMIRVCAVCGSSYPSTCAAAHRPREVCSLRCRVRRHRGQADVSSAAA